MLAYVCADDEDDSFVRFFELELANDLSRARALKAGASILLDRWGETRAISNIPADAAARLAYLEPDGSYRDGGRFSSSTGTDGDLGVPTTLTDFVKRQVGTDVAGRKIALALCGHGVGSRYVCRDSTDQMHELPLHTMSKALADALPKQKRVDLVVMYACTMASIEAASALEPIADGLLASQATILGDANLPDSGFDCSALEVLDDVATGEEFFRGVGQESGFAARYLRAPGPHVPGRFKTISFTRLASPEFAQLRELVNATGRGLAKALADPTHGGAVADAAVSAATDDEVHLFAPRFHGTHAHLVDLGDVAASLVKHLSAIQGLPADLKDPILRSAREVPRLLSACTSSQDDSPSETVSGLSIYFPPKPTKANLEDYAKLTALDGWLEFLQGLLARPDVVQRGLEDRASLDGSAAARWTIAWGRAGPRTVWLRLCDSRGEVVGAVPLRLPAADPAGAGSFEFEYDGRVPWVRFGASGGGLALPIVAVRSAPGSPARREYTVLGELRRRDDATGGWVPVAMDFVVEAPPEVLFPPSASLVAATAILPSGALWNVALRGGDEIRRARLHEVDREGLWSTREPIAETTDSYTVPALGTTPIRLEFAAPPVPVRLMLIPSGSPVELEASRVSATGKVDRLESAAQSP